MLCNPKAQVAAGRKVGGPPVVKLEMQGTRGFPGSFASAAIIGSCEAVGAKILLFVSSGTESCASDRRPSYPTKKNVESLIMGQLRVPPNSTGVIICLAAINGDVVAPPVAPIKRQPALRSLLNSKIGIAGDVVGIACARG